MRKKVTVNPQMFAYPVLYDSKVLCVLLNITYWSLAKKLWRQRKKLQSDKAVEVPFEKGTRKYIRAEHLVYYLEEVLKNKTEEVIKNTLGTQDELRRLLKKIETGEEHIECKELDT